MSERETVQCAECGKIIQAMHGPDVQAEADRLFGAPRPDEHQVVVCDRCYQQIKRWHLMKMN